MSDERRYAAVEVIGKARGMNQAGWEGAISDAEATRLYNMGTTIDGEWAKRKGYVLRKSIALSSDPVAKLYWKTDTITAGERSRTGAERKRGIDTGRFRRSCGIRRLSGF